MAIKGSGIILLVCCCLASSSASAIECLSAAGHPKSGWYAWREIEGRRCWFVKTGAMPAKSQLHWPAKVKEEARSIDPPLPPQERTEPAAVAAPQTETTNRAEPKPQTPPQFSTARVKPVTGASRPLGNGQVDLLSGASLSTMHALGGARQKPANLAPADPFSARFTGNGN
jgi:hypothetical protein